MSPARKTFAISLLLAVLGFSYSLAIQLEHASASSGGGQIRTTDASALRPRAVGQPLRFTNPFLIAGSDPAFPNGGAAVEPQGFDLGDAVPKIQFVRYLTAAGGFVPRTFEIRPNFEFIATNATPPIPKLFLNGRIADQFDATFGTVSTTFPLRFNAVVTDFVAAQRTGTFRLNLMPAPQKLRFAQDRLPTAQLGNTFFTNLETLVPTGAVTFSIIPGTTLAGTTALNRLEDAGLALTPDGVIFGRPCVSAPAAATTIAFTVRAVDSLGQIASSRDGSRLDQPFVLNIENNTQTTSEITTLKSTVAGSSLFANQDSFVYYGAFDPKNETVASLAGSPFTLRIGGALYTGNFDDKGKIKQSLGGKKSELEVSVSPTRGVISIKLTGTNLAAAVAASGGGGNYNLSVVLMMEFKHYRACEALQYKGRGAGGKFALKYALGVFGVPKAGAFQVLTVAGKDGKFYSGVQGAAGVPGDTWFVRWLGVPRFSIDTGASTALPVRDPKAMAQSGSVMTTIRIGDAFSQQVSAAIKSTRLRFKAKGTDPGIYSLILDGERFVHSMQTNVLDPSDTGLSQAIDAKDPTIFKFGMDIPNFSGETGRVIAPDRYRWVQR